MPESIIDPVTGFHIPVSWIEQCRDAEAITKIGSGRWVILSDGRLLKRGLTTGTTSAAACKGAVLSLQRPIDFVEVMTPAGLRVSLPVVSKEGFCIAVKEGGDHQFDVTDGVEIFALAHPGDKTELLAGKGVGRIAADGLCADLGMPAISRYARQQIMKAIDEGLQETEVKGATVELCVPRGVVLAKQTLNPSLGIQGGISILGSTGFVEPWNDHLVDSKMEELKHAKKVVVTCGRTGLKFSRILFPDHQAVLVGSKLDRIKFEGDQESILCGLPALILRWAWPDVLEGTGRGTVADLVQKDPDHGNITRALEKAKMKLPNTRIVLLQKDGSIFRDVP
jgi:cobalt-precorrin-5B (C1)-methyltransferase